MPAFWIFMLIMTLLIPLSMIFFGDRFIKKPPKDINAVYGYRTRMSMKNMDTWLFAHNYAGRIWRAVGFVLLIITLFVMNLVDKNEIKLVGMVAGALSLAQILPMLLSLIPVEIALRKNFTQEGIRKIT
jgi:uncharacterized membrane protein